MPVILTSVNINDWLSSSTKKLRASGIGTARLDCLVLLEDTIGKDRAWLLANPDHKLSTSQVKKLDTLVARRAAHEPLAYIRGKTEFYGRDFIINYNVLEPRPESETMIELLKNLSGIDRIADIGTGSGALGITANLELPETEVIASDIDPKCIKLARENANKHNVEIDFYAGDLLDPIAKPIDVIIANLPYVPTDFKLNDAAMQEPKIAIFGGTDGLDVYRRLFAQTAKLSQVPKYILTESLPFQHKELSKIAESAGYRQFDKADFVQLFVTNRGTSSY